MPEGLAIGLTKERTYVVTADMSPPHLTGVLSTPRMIGLIEDTCLEALAPCLDEARTTVGTQISMSHIGTAHTGEEIGVRIRLTKITRRRLLSFEVEVRGDSGLLGAGSHQRLVVDKSRFERKASPALQDRASSSS